MYADLKLSTNTIINLIINDLNSYLKIWGNKNLRIYLSYASCLGDSANLKASARN